MTVAVNDRRIQYTATAGQTVFPYDFEISNQSDVVVLQNGTTLTITTDYTVSGVGNAAGGNITLTTGAALNDSIVIFGNEAIERETDFSSTGNFLAATLDEQLDSIVRWGQQLDRDLGRAVKLKEEDTTSSLELPVAATRASKFLAFDSNGDAIAAEGSEGSFPVSSFGATLIDDADAAEARATLGVGSNINTTNIDALTSSGGNLRTSGDTNCLSWGSGGAANITLGGNMSGASTHKLVSMQDPTDAQDYATKAYVDGNRGGQCIQTVDTTNRSTSAASQQDTGVQAIITPTSASSKVLVTVQGILGNGSAVNGRAVRLNIDRGGTDLTPAGVNGNLEVLIPAGDDLTHPFSFSFLDSPSTTSATTYKLQWALTSTGVTIYTGRRGADTVIDCPTILTLQEVA